VHLDRGRRLEHSEHWSATPLCEPDRPTSVFFSCGTAVNMARNAWLEACGELLHLVFNPEKKPAFEQKLTHA